MNLREIIAAFAEIEKDLSITEPIELRVKDVYKYLPPARKSAISTPCFMHQWRPAAETRGPNGLRQRDFILRVQMLVGRIGADTHIKSEAAAAFDEAFVTAFDGAVKLRDTRVYQRSAGEEQEFQPMLLEWNGLGYVGLQYDYLVSVHDTVMIGP